MVKWHNPALTLDTQEVNMTALLFFLQYVVTQNWMTQRIKEVRKNSAIQQTFYSAPTPRARVQRWQMHSASESTQGSQGGQHDASTNNTWVKDNTFVMGTWREYHYALQIHIGGSISQILWVAYLCLMAATMGNKVAVICSSYSL